MSQSILWKNLALVEHKDEENFRILLDRAELTVEVANIPDKEGKTPMTYCLTKGEIKSLPRCICKQFFFQEYYLFVYISVLAERIRMSYLPIIVF